jgi:hypothetical protein
MAASLPQKSDKPKKQIINSRVPCILGVLIVERKWDKPKIILPLLKDINYVSG